MKIIGSKILITGASGGIGGAIARLLATHGASLVLVDRDADKLDALANDLSRTKSSAIALACELTEPGAPAQVIEQAVKRMGTIDILINCAGIQNFGFFADEDARATATLFNVNTIAPIALINAALPHMLRNRRGQIVNLGSIFGSIGFPCFASYSASKFALRGFSEALRRELWGSGVGVTYVAPRFTKTTLNRGAVARMADALNMNQDAPETVARSVVAAIERDGRDSYLGWPEKLFVRINSILPRIVDQPLMKQVAQMRPFANEHVA